MPASGSGGSWGRSVIAPNTCDAPRTRFASHGVTQKHVGRHFVERAEATVLGDATQEVRVARQPVMPVAVVQREHGGGARSDAPERRRLPVAVRGMVVQREVVEQD